MKAKALFVTFVDRFPYYFIPGNSERFWIFFKISYLVHTWNQATECPFENSTIKDY